MNAYRIKYTNNYGTETVFYIDAATWYIIESQSTYVILGNEVDNKVTYSNYKQTDFGVYMPYTVHVYTGVMEEHFDINTQKVEVNKQIDPTIFDMPK